MDDDEDEFRRRKQRPSSHKNFFDEEVPIEEAKQMLRNVYKPGDDDDFEEDAEIIGFDALSIKYDKRTSQPSPQLPPFSTQAPTPAAFRTNSTLPESKHSFGSFQKAAGHVRSASWTTVPPKQANEPGSRISDISEKSGSSSSLTIEDVVGSGKKGVQNIDQLQQEIQMLKRELLKAKKERWSKLDIESTLRRILQGEAYSLEPYRSLADKLALVDKAVVRMDGNAIIAAVLHLKCTVRQSIFHSELKIRPIAANHYLSYLRCHYEYAELVELLGILDRKEEAAIIRYKLACNSGDDNVKISNLKTCLRAHFEANLQLSSDAGLVREHIDLLERQQAIEHDDARKEAEGKTKIFLDFPRRCSLVNMPVTTTLFYCSLYHYDLPENNFASPQSIKKRHDLPERQFILTAVSARAKARAWHHIEQILTAKGWFGGKKLKAAIGFDRVVEIIHKFRGPTDVLAKYLELIDDLDVRVAQSQKVGCHKITIETLVKMKDHAGVEEFARKHGNTIEADYARRCLNDETIRWK